MIGAWRLKSIRGSTDLYTRVCADIYVDSETGEDYVRGEYELFECGAEKKPLPELVENTGKFKFMYHDKSAQWTAEDSLREIMVQGFLNN